MLGYAGGCLVLGALIALTGGYWRSLVAQIALAGVVFAICLPTGWWLSSRSLRQARRLGSFLLLLATAALGLLVARAVGDSGIGGEAALYTEAGPPSSAGPRCGGETAPHSSCWA